MASVNVTHPRDKFARPGRQRGTDEPAISAIAPKTGGAKVRSDKVTHWQVSVEHAADVARRIRSVNCHG